MEQAARPMSSPPVQHLAQEGLQKARSICDRMQILTLDRQIEACQGLFAENLPPPPSLTGLPLSPNINPSDSKESVPHDQTIEKNRYPGSLRAHAHPLYR